MKTGEVKTGTLYVVATPIGNLEDVTLRALRVLKAVSLIAAEDTRRTKKLLSTYGIPTRMISLHDQNERSRSAFLISRLKEGEEVAYVTDAGTPGISDPGYVLVHQALAEGIRVVPVPGASAVIAALSVAGLPMDSFVFIGFVPNRAMKRRRFLDSLKDEERTMVIYESPRRFLDLLRDIRDIMGNREVVVARELTKIFEEIRRGTVGEIIETLEGHEVRGELTLVVAGKKQGYPVCSVPDIALRLRELMGEGGISTKDAVRKIADETDLPRKTVYGEVLRLLGKSVTDRGGENP